VSIIVEKNTPLTPLKRGIKKTPESYPIDKEKNQAYYSKRMMSMDEKETIFFLTLIGIRHNLSLCKFAISLFLATFTHEKKGSVHFLVLKGDRYDKKNY
jgi:hypothetical protein